MTVELKTMTRRFPACVAGPADYRTVGLWPGRQPVTGNLGFCKAPETLEHPGRCCFCLAGLLLELGALRRHTRRPWRAGTIRCYWKAALRAR